MINGIQQVGIGTTDVHESWKWYRKNFGFTTKVFDEAAEAPLMTQYTGGAVHARHAMLAMNLNGGGGMEIWQFTSRRSADQLPFSLLRTGLLVTRIKCTSAAQAQKSVGSHAVGNVHPDPAGNKSFAVIDPWGNPFIAAESNAWFNKKGLFGGIEGIVIGVSNMEKSLKFYQKVLQIDQVVFDQTAVFEDFNALAGGENEFRRVRLKPSKRNTGAFSEVFGEFYLELIQPTKTPNLPHNLSGRYWGDQGYIHLCFDVNNMNSIKERAKQLENPFTIDSGETFSMGEAAGRFAYVEDPDHTLIELVETDRITISKKPKLFLTLTESRKRKPLPRLLFWFMGLSSTKD